jgi:hypothetical protein
VGVFTLALYHLIASAGLIGLRFSMRMESAPAARIQPASRAGTGRPARQHKPTAKAVGCEPTLASIAAAPGRPDEHMRVETMMFCPLVCCLVDCALFGSLLRAPNHRVAGAPAALRLASCPGPADAAPLAHWRRPISQSADLNCRRPSCNQRGPRFPHRDNNGAAADDDER